MRLDSCVIQQGICLFADSVDLLVLLIDQRGDFLGLSSHNGTVQKVGSYPTEEGRNCQQNTRHNMLRCDCKYGPGHKCGSNHANRIGNRRCLDIFLCFQGRDLGHTGIKVALKPG